MAATLVSSLAGSSSYKLVAYLPVTSSLPKGHRQVLCERVKVPQLSAPGHLHLTT